MLVATLVDLNPHQVDAAPLAFQRQPPKGVILAYEVVLATAQLWAKRTTRQVAHRIGFDFNAVNSDVQAALVYRVWNKAVNGKIKFPS